MLPNNLFVHLFSFFLIRSLGYAFKKELQSDQKYLSGCYTKNFSIASILFGAIPFS